jgi:cyclohexyl-isocyanide hydratase
MHRWACAIGASSEKETAMEFDRRVILAIVAGMVGSTGFGSDASAREGDDFAHPFRHDPNLHDDIAMLVYPEMTILDLVGPYYFLSLIGGAKIHLVTTQPDLSPVISDTGMGIQPTKTMADCPRDLTLLFVPGGSGGNLRTARDGATIAFLRDRASRAKYITSVCTGALILGVAGLLRGRRATTHWSVLDALPHFGAIPVRERVVEDGNLITAAGVSAGLDFGVLMVDRLRGRPWAEAATLVAQYAPEPPFAVGTPETARPDIRVAVTDVFKEYIDQAMTLRPAPGSI